MPLKVVFFFANIWYQLFPQERTYLECGIKVKLSHPEYVALTVPLEDVCV